MKRLIATTAVLALASLPALAQSVHVVDDDGGPGVDFLEICAAVAAAAPGDVVLIKSGTYSGVFVDKPISLVADEGADVSLPSIQGQQIHSGELVLHGLDISPSFGLALALQDVSAPILVQDCLLAGGILAPGIGGGPGLELFDCDAATLSGCTVFGGTLNDGSPSLAVSVSSSTVVFFDSQIAAASGMTGMLFNPPEDGGAGLVATGGSLVFCQRTTITAGNGGNNGLLCMGGDGGDGAILLGASELRLFDSVVTGGSAGFSDPGCTPAADGQDVDDTDGTLVQHPGQARSFDAPSLRREQQTWTFDVEGEPGDVAFVGFDLAIRAPVFLAGPPTPLSIFVPPPPLRLQLGVVPASGMLSMSFFFGNLPPAFEALPLQMQLGIFSSQGLALGNTRRLVWLDSSF